MVNLLRYEQEGTMWQHNEAAMRLMEADIG